jgi:2,3-bisphosphoglycerate-independent phosphoglycerate mutase
MDEKMRILKMVEEGTITAEQAAELMAAMNVELPVQQTAIVKSGYDKKMLRVIVDSVSGDKVNIQFPVGAVKKILKVTGRLPIPEKDLEGIDLSSMMDAISECLDEEIEGDFVNVSAADGTTVRIFVDK